MAYASWWNTSSVRPQSFGKSFKWIGEPLDRAAICSGCWVCCCCFCWEQQTSGVRPMCPQRLRLKKFRSAELECFLFANLFKFGQRFNGKQIPAWLLGIVQSPNPHKLSVWWERESEQIKNEIRSWKYKTYPIVAASMEIHSRKEQAKWLEQKTLRKNWKESSYTIDKRLFLAVLLVSMLFAEKPKCN